tara:strand:+ start:1653 stop:3179 length:1527 start_codon:yes stop_codon:yes gene_type:complete
MSARILIVDDDPVQRRLLKGAVEREGMIADTADDGNQAVKLITNAEKPYDAVVLDLVMPGMDGLSVLAWMSENGHGTPAIVQTGLGGIETVVKAMRAGAFDFVVKPVSPERLMTAIGHARKAGTKDRNSGGGAKITGGFADIVVASPAMDRILSLAKRAAASDIPVVLEGESGVGKEMIARAIQIESARRARPYVTVNCGAIPASLVESILFGHEKGAFTGAVDNHTGKFVEADRGTLFLDEVGDLPPEVQVKLLRAVQTGEIETVGARDVRKVDIRLISATNKDLIEEVKAGRFREDLYYRLNVFPIHVPALRQRKEDIPELARHFVRRYAQSTVRSPHTTLAPEALALLTAHDWPGNIRELENAIHRAVVLSDTETLGADLFPQIAAQLPGYDLASRRHSGGLEEMSWVPSIEFDPVKDQGPAMIGYEEQGAVKTHEPEGALNAIASNGQVRPLAEVEEELIRFALSFYDGQMSEVARRLGIGRSTLYRKLKDYAIDPGSPLKTAA